MSSDLNAQMSKLAVGLLSFVIVCTDEEGGVRPRMEQIVDRKRTYVVQYEQTAGRISWQHLLSRLDNIEKGPGPSTNSLFEFETEIRKECASTMV